MKIAAISDIHGNMEALNAVIGDIQKQGCEKIFVLGDYAMAGPDPNDAIQFFMGKLSNPKYVMIQGNTDVMIADYNDDLYEKLKEKAPIMAHALKNDAVLLGMAEKLFLKSLPIQKEINIGGVRFLLVHGSPRKNNEDISPNLSLVQVEEMLVNVDANVILCGHTHIPCGYQTSTQQTVVNVGSVGRPFTKEPKACYLLITVEDGKCVFEHQFIDYDKICASEKLNRRNFWGADKLAKMLLNPQQRHF